MILFDAAIDQAMMLFTQRYIAKNGPQEGACKSERSERIHFVLSNLPSLQKYRDDLNRIRQCRNLLYHQGWGHAPDGREITRADLTADAIYRAIFGAPDTATMPDVIGNDLLRFYASAKFVSTMTTFLNQFSALVDRYEGDDRWMSQTGGIIEEWNILVTLNPENPELRSMSRDVERLAQAWEDVLSKGLGARTASEFDVLSERCSPIMVQLNNKVTVVPIQQRLLGRLSKEPIGLDNITFQFKTFPETAEPQDNDELPDHAHLKAIGSKWAEPVVRFQRVVESHFRRLCSTEWRTWRFDLWNEQFLDESGDVPIFDPAAGMSENVRRFLSLDGIAEDFVEVLDQLKSEDVRDNEVLEWVMDALTEISEAASQARDVLESAIGREHTFFKCIMYFCVMDHDRIKQLNESEMLTLEIEQRILRTLAELQRADASREAAAAIERLESELRRRGEEDGGLHQDTE